jgi:energy-coupling factor transporter ATP-binding protein EcfA2
MDVNNMSNARGSEWRKWDLHLHSLHSNLNNNFDSITEYQFIDKVVQSELRVVGLTNYFKFNDNDFSLKKALENKGIVVFLNLELRLSYQNNDRNCCDIHVLFDNNLGKNEINRFLDNLSVDVDGEEKKAHALTTQNDFQKGVVEFDKLLNILKDPALKLTGKFLIGCLSRGKGTARTSSVYEKIGQNADFILHSTANQENITKDVGYWLDQGKPLIQSSDAHRIEQIGIKYTWIKSDPTFKGLKQILYEPEERVRIKETNPSLEFDKSPFTEIQIGNDVAVFEDNQDNIVLGKCSLPLNSGLVSIIGGRGTGKSILVDYISAGLGQIVKKKYTKNDEVAIKRKPSLKDDETSFVISDNPHVQFMYISQSEIKSIVEKPQEFTKNIRETIGVVDDYTVSSSYTEKANRYINEYLRVAGSLVSDESKSIDEEIKKYEDFIINVTSQENKQKLKKYQEYIQHLERRKTIRENLQELRERILQFENDTNKTLEDINKRIVNLNLKIPILNNSDTTNYILKDVVPAMTEVISATEQEISNTKKAFPGYTGDLATLLSDVAQYQKKMIELQSLKEGIETNEKNFETIKQTYFKELGTEIKNSINAYKSEIENQWNIFKNGRSDYSEEQKQLLSYILDGENLNVSVDINFDTGKMYQLLLEKLDGRSWNAEKLQSKICIDGLESYIHFVTQTAEINTFSDVISPIRNQVLDVFFRRYNEFITHNIIVSSKNKNITKLSHGQQGTIYLRLKLAANLFSKTIIYDQPEDDLDNEFIMEHLVSIFKKIKKYRQIIIVSHNANLVVNADSEQVIVARNDDGILKYTSGSLEDVYISKQICKILEGGKTAFLNREKKYGFRNKP